MYIFGGEATSMHRIIHKMKFTVQKLSTLTSTHSSGLNRTMWRVKFPQEDGVTQLVSRIMTLTFHFHFINFIIIYTHRNAEFKWSQRKTFTSKTHWTLQIAIENCITLKVNESLLLLFIWAVNLESWTSRLESWVGGNEIWFQWDLYLSSHSICLSNCHRTNRVFSLHVAP